MYLFCYHLARGNKYLKNKHYLDLFYFCLTRAGAECNHGSRRDFDTRPSESRPRLQGDAQKPSVRGRTINESHRPEMPTSPTILALGGAHIDRRGQVSGVYVPAASNPCIMR